MIVSGFGRLVLVELGSVLCKNGHGPRKRGLQFLFLKIRGIILKTLQGIFFLLRNLEKKISFTNSQRVLESYRGSKRTSTFRKPRIWQKRMSLVIRPRNTKQSSKTVLNWTNIISISLECQTNAFSPFLSLLRVLAIKMGKSGCESHATALYAWRYEVMSVLIQFEMYLSIRNRSSSSSTGSIQKSVIFSLTASTKVSQALTFLS